MVRDRAPAVGREDRGDRRRLRLAVLDHEHAARMQQRERAPREHANDVEPVGAAVERALGIVQPHLGVARDLACRHVGRVRDDDRDPAVELGQGVGEVAEDELEVVGADLVDVAPRPRERLGRVLDRPHPRVRHLGREREGDRAAAGAEVDARSARARPRRASASIASCATCSVSGRGTKTPGPDRELEVSGTPRAR